MHCLQQPSHTHPKIQLLQSTLICAPREVLVNVGETTPTVLASRPVHTINRQCRTDRPCEPAMLAWLQARLSQATLSADI